METRATVRRSGRFNRSKRLFYRGSLTVVFVIASLLALSGCEGLFFRRNPDLVCISPSDSFEAQSPAWAPDGRIIYFIQQTDHMTPGRGQIRAVRSDGSCDHLVLDGIFSIVCVSPDGSKLAAVAISGIRESGGRLLLFDTSGRDVDTLTPASEAVTAAQFGLMNDEVYYLAPGSGGELRVNVTSHKVDTVFRKTSWNGLVLYPELDVWKDSLVLYPQGMGNLYTSTEESLPLDLSEPRFDRDDPDTILSPILTDWARDLVLIDRKTGSQTHLNANPFYVSDIIDPCWSPDGRSIVMAAAEVQYFVMGGTVALPHELWILRR
jgi:hypothetical protein